ncbi:hypothetical protein B2G69_07810 [Methylorubrum zatmanii]|nr:hypothetical protein [Methylorubrum zatmanii]ARO54060.1 hypothetical protein B2G69_07810 [Methylorubrum zatmanii]
MTCGLAPLAIAAVLSGPMCPRTDLPAPDRMDQVMVALRGDARVETVATDPQFEAAIRAIRQQPPKPAKRRARR